MCPTVNLFFNLHSHFKVLIGVLQRARERTLHEGCHGLAVLSVSRSVVSDSGTPRTAARQAPLPLTISQSLLKCMSIESVMPCNHLSSAAHFASCPQSLPARGSFPASWLFPSGGRCFCCPGGRPSLIHPCFPRAQWRACL